MTPADSGWELAARAVLARFPVPARCELEALGNHGGFSGARLWRVGSDAGFLCLRAWPVGQPSADRLAAIHALMHRAAAVGLAFVPALWRSDNGETIVAHGGRLWELTTWMPGRAAFRASPSRVRLEAACVALAQLHGVWQNPPNVAAVCPAVQRRMQHVQDWLKRAEQGWQVPDRAGTESLSPWAARAWQAVRPRLGPLQNKLRPWLEHPRPVQPCLCDIWHDHVLFDGDRVSGIVDYGAVKIDHVAVDLARLLGSLVEDDAELRRAGLTAYRRVRPLSEEEEALIAVLDEATTILGAANWLKWIYIERKSFEHMEHVAARLARLVERMERWK